MALVASDRILPRNRREQGTHGRPRPIAPRDKRAIGSRKVKRSFVAEGELIFGPAGQCGRSRGPARQCWRWPTGVQGRDELRPNRLYSQRCGSAASGADGVRPLLRQAGGNRDASRTVQSRQAGCGLTLPDSRTRLRRSLLQLFSARQGTGTSVHGFSACCGGCDSLGAYRENPQIECGRDKAALIAGRSPQN
jgi:hypothetical protein